MPKTAEHDPPPSRWQTLKEQLRPWFSRGEEAAPPAAPSPVRGGLHSLRPGRATGNKAADSDP